MIIPEWLFELPIILPERNEFRNSKNDRVIKDSKSQMTSTQTENEIIPLLSLYLVVECYKWGTILECIQNPCRRQGRFNFIGMYHIRLYHLVIGHNT